MSLPTDSAARKRIPMYEGLLKYFPDALAAVAQHSFESNEKHNPGEPVHWSREKAADHKDTIIRHMTDIATGADEVDELKAVAWRSLAALQLAIEAKVAKPKVEVIEWIENPNGSGSFSPVPLDALVECHLRRGSLYRSRASEIAWERNDKYPNSGDVMEYRVLPEPRLCPSRPR